MKGLTMSKIVHFPYEIIKKNHFFPASVEQALKEVLDGISVSKMSKSLSKIINMSPTKIKAVILQPSCLKWSEVVGKVLRWEFEQVVDQYILEQLSKKIVIENFFPQNHVKITSNHYSENWYIELKALSTHKTKLGNVHYSNRYHRIEVDGEKFIVAYTKHAIQQLFSRQYNNQVSAAAIANTFCLIDSTIHYEIEKLVDGQLAIVLYDLIYKDHALTETVIKIMGDDYDVRSSYYQKVGYYPIELIDKYAICKTLIPCGYRKTPEYQGVKKHFCNSPELHEILESISQYDFGQFKMDLYQNNYIKYNPLEIFHRAGVSVVNSYEHEINDARY